MSLIGTLNSGVSAMKSFTKDLEVIGNNIANVNTTAYKGSSTSFEDSFSNTLRASAPSIAGTGASNLSAIQVGSGVQIGAINARFTQGSLSATGVATDLGVSGNGFFRVLNTVDGSEYATRAGDFRIDDQGYLVTSKGYKVQGLTGGTSNSAPGVVGSVRLRTNDEIAVSWPTHNAERIAATSSDATVANYVETNMTTLSTTAATAAAGAVAAGAVAQNNAAKAAATAALTLAIQAETNALATAQATPTNAALATAAKSATALKNAISSAISFGDAAVARAASPTGGEFMGALTAAATNATNSSVAADETARLATKPATLASFSIDRKGNLVENYSDGSSATSNRLLLQNFNDPSALQRVGDNLFAGFEAAGAIGGTALSADNNAPGSGGLGSIESGTLELSNVDLTEQFANMISAQRSFQASSRVVTVSDSVLEEIVNLKR